MDRSPSTQPGSLLNNDGTLLVVEGRTKLEMSITKSLASQKTCLLPPLCPSQASGSSGPSAQSDNMPVLLACASPQGPGDQAWGCRDCLVNHMGPCQIRGSGGFHVPAGAIHPSTGPTTVPGTLWICSISTPTPCSPASPWLPSPQGTC